MRNRSMECARAPARANLRAVFVAAYTDPEGRVAPRRASCRAARLRRPAHSLMAVRGEEL